LVNGDEGYDVEEGETKWIIKTYSLVYGVPDSEIPFDEA
jgi:hypothetical protein